MSEKSFTVATTNFGSTDVKHLRYFYLVFSMHDTIRNAALLDVNEAIEVTITADRNEEEVYSFIPTTVGYHRERIPLKHTHKGVLWTVKLALKYDFSCEFGECLVIPITRR